MSDKNWFAISAEAAFLLYFLKRGTAESVQVHYAARHSRWSIREKLMVPFFVQIKCHLGQTYPVASKLADAEIASEIYSTAGEFDLLAKFYVEPDTDIGHFVNSKLHAIPGIQDTRTIMCFQAFTGSS